MESHHHDHGHGHVEAVHNMSLVGARSIFLSHLPMFMSPHDAQVIFEGNFMMAGKKLNDAYFADRASHPEVAFYTVQPESFAIQELFQSDATHPLRTRFKATVFRGHLEKGGTAVDALQNVDVEIKRMVHAHSFTGDKLQTLTYILFGRDKELFLGHLISKAPDFDQILSISVKGKTPSAAELQRGLTVEVPGRPNLPADRLKSQETVAVRATVTGTAQPLDLNITAQAELYFEEGELLSTKMSGKLFDQTPEEKKAGFD
jgi:hypothetical protein